MESLRESLGWAFSIITSRIKNATTSVCSNLIMLIAHSRGCTIRHSSSMYHLCFSITGSDTKDALRSKDKAENYELVTQYHRANYSLLIIFLFLFFFLRFSISPLLGKCRIAYTHLAAVACKVT